MSRRGCAPLRGGLGGRRPRPARGDEAGPRRGHARPAVDGRGQPARQVPLLAVLDLIADLRDARVDDDAADDLNSNEKFTNRTTDIQVVSGSCFLKKYTYRTDNMSKIDASNNFSLKYKLVIRLFEEFN